MDFYLPFRGFWLVLWDVKTQEHNIHYSVQSQKYALAFRKVSEDGKFVKSDGKTCKTTFRLAKMYWRQQTESFMKS